MPWIQIRQAIPPHLVEACEALYTELGACALTLADAAEEPLFEPPPGTTPLWRHTRIQGLFDASEDSERLCRQLAEAQGHWELASALPPPHAEILEDKDWERAWMAHFQPLRFGRRLWVCPSWLPVPDPQAVNLMLDPGLAFGTGTHPTTALCLEWLDSESLEGRVLLDYGCGSGILGIAGLLLGASGLLATDIDAQALQATAANARRNGIDAKHLKLMAPEKLPEGSAGVLVANILAGPLQALAPRLAELAAAGARLALSGVLVDQVEDLAGAYAPFFDLDPPRERDGWALLTGTRRAHTAG